MLSIHCGWRRKPHDPEKIAKETETVVRDPWNERTAVNIFEISEVIPLLVLLKLSYERDKKQPLKLLYSRIEEFWPSWNRVGYHSYENEKKSKKTRKKSKEKGEEEDEEQFGKEPIFVTCCPEKSNLCIIDVLRHCSSFPYLDPDTNGKDGNSKPFY